MRYFPPLVNGEMQLDTLNLVNTIHNNLDISEGYLQFLYNPDNKVLTLEFYNDREDFLSLQESPNKETYISRLAQTLYMTFTINPENMTKYTKTTRISRNYSKYNPYQLISWGNGFENDLLNNHYDFLEILFDYLFDDEKHDLLSKIETFLIEGIGGSEYYKEINERYTSWKPLADGIFIMEIMEEDNE